MITQTINDSARLLTSIRPDMTITKNACVLLLSGLNELDSAHDILMNHLSKELIGNALACMHIDMRTLEHDWHDGSNMSLHQISRTIDAAVAYMSGEFRAPPTVIARGPIGNLLLSRKNVRRILINPTHFHDIDMLRVQKQGCFDTRDLHAYFTASALCDLYEARANGLESPAHDRRKGKPTLERIYARHMRYSPDVLSGNLTIMFPQIIDGKVFISHEPDASHYEDFAYNTLLQCRLAETIQGVMMQHGMLA